MRKLRTRLAGLLGLCVLLGLCAAPAAAMERGWGWARILSSGAPAPSATVTVYDAGTLNLSTIYSDNLLTPKANPFTADSTAYWYFYGANGRYDLVFSGGGIPTPYTLGDFLILDSTAVGSLCGVSGSGITLTSGTTGADLAWSCNDGTDTITLNVPNAGAAARGLVSTGAQTFAGAKTFSTPIAAGSGGTGFDGSTAGNGKLPIGNGAGFTLANLTGTTGQINVVNGAGSITLGLPQDIDVASTPSFDGVTLTGPFDNTQGQVVWMSKANGGALETRALLDGQLLVGDTLGDPVAANLSAAPGIGITSGAGTITIGNTFSLNGASAATYPTQLFSLGTTGTDANWATAAGTHTLNLPSASAFARGLVTNSQQDFGGSKGFIELISPLLRGARDAAGTNTAGTNLQMNAGRGTGTGTTGITALYMPQSGTSGSTGHTLAVREQWQAFTAADPAKIEVNLVESHGGHWVRGVQSELVTLSTVGATTDTVNQLLPANAIIEAAATYVTTAISGGGVTSFRVGKTAGGASDLCATSTGIAATSSQVCFNAITLGTTVQAAADTVRITTLGGIPTQGVLRVVVWYRRFVAPTS